MSGSKSKYIDVLVSSLLTGQKHAWESLAEECPSDMICQVLYPMGRESVILQLFLNLNLLSVFPLLMYMSNW